MIFVYKRKQHVVYVLSLSQCWLQGMNISQWNDNDDNIKLYLEHRVSENVITIQILFWCIQIASRKR